MNADGDYDNAAYWDYGGVALPDYGAFAERYDGIGSATQLVVDLTGIGLTVFADVDLYLWQDDEGVPGQVIRHEPQVVVPGTYPFYPAFGRFFLDFSSPVAVNGTWWIGYWPNWPSSNFVFAIGLDADGDSVTGATKVAPGQDWPQGWQALDTVWPGGKHFGIGAMFEPSPPVPVETTSWGRVKAIYGR